MRKIVILIVICLVSSAAYAASYLELPRDALSSSVNRAGDTIIKDTYAIYNNPANLIFLFSDEVSFSYLYFIDDIRQGNLTFARRMKNFPVVCIDLSYLTYGGITEVFTDKSGNFAGVGNEINLWFLQTGLSSAIKINLFDQYVFLGSRASFLINHLDQSYYGFLLNTGLMYYPDFKGWIFSFVVNNMGFLDSFSTVFPLEVKFGIGYNIYSWQTELNYDMGDNNLLRWGNKIRIFRNFYALAGYRFDSRNIMQNNFNTGMQFDYLDFNFNYTLIPNTGVGYYHYFSIKKRI